MQLITIMADYGNGPYAWLNDNPDDSNAPGGNVADMTWGFLDWNISKELEADFADWILPFDRDSFHNPESLPWEEFHRRGIELTRRLKREVGSAFRVRYVKPSEDPNHRVNCVVEMEADSE